MGAIDQGVTRETRPAASWLANTLAAFACLCAFEVRADYIVDRWTVEDGLPVSGVTAVHRDPGGYLWLATFDGLVRFDGRRFVVFDSAEALDSRRLVDLLRSSDGSLWVLGEQQRLARFDGRTFLPATLADGLPDERVHLLRLDSHGVLWVGTAAGAAYWDGTRFRPAIADGRDAGDVSSLFVERGGDLWVGHADGALLRVHSGRVKERHLALAGATGRGVSDIAQMPDGTIVFGGRGGVARLRDGQVESIAATRGHAVLALGVRPDGGLLARVDAGTLWLDSIDSLDGVAARLEPGPPLAHGAIVGRAPDAALWTNGVLYLMRNAERVYVSECPVRDHAYDADGSVWVASECEGLVRLRPRQVQLLSHEGGHARTSVAGLAQTPDGALWVSSLAGVQRWRDGEVDLEPALRGADAGFPHDGILANQRRTLYSDRDGALWVGQLGVCLMSGDACRAPPDFPPPLQAEQIDAIHRDSSGGLWIGGDAHLWYRHSDGRWDARDNVGRDRRRGAVRAIAEQPDGTLWFGMRHAGLWRRTPAQQWRQFLHGDGLAGESVRDLYYDGRGRLWIATEDRGLCRLIELDGASSIRCLGEDKGLYSNSLHRIIEDGRGRLWFNSNRGVFWIDVAAIEAVLDGDAARVHPRVYGKRDGLPNPEGNGGVQGAGLRMLDGRIAFPTQGGVVIFDPTRSESTDVQARVEIDSLELLDGPAFAAAGEVALPAGERSFAVNFAALAPALTDPLYTRYRLLPDEPRWQDLGAEGRLRFVRLAPGRYELEIAALDAASGVQGPVTRLVILLPERAWETRPFLLASLLLLVASVSVWLLQRAAGVRRRARELEQRVEQRTAALRELQVRTESALQTVQHQREEIAHLAAVKSQFFASVSHELRTPLSLLAGPLQEAVRGAPIAPALAEMMLRNARRLERLVTQLLDLERIDVGRFPLRPERRDLDELMREAAAAFEPVALQHNLRLRVDSAPDMVECLVDADQIARVFGNLLSNALKFTPHGGEIVLRLEPVGDEARVEVDDTGPGVPSDWRERIFDRFSQVGADATRSREGAGLGLSLCREIAALHGGRLWVEERPGGGSRFVLTLPQAGADAAPVLLPVPRAHHDASLPLSPVAATASARAAAPDGLRRRVLVAEDHSDLRAYIEGILRRDYDVLVAEDGAVALAVARAELPDLIVSDVMMPHCDGLELALALRADEATAGIPLIFLTARASEADEIVALMSGADQYLRKPFDAEVLRAHVAAALHAVERLRRRLAGASAQPLAPAGSDLEEAADSAAPAPATIEFARHADAWLAAHLHDEGLSIDAMAAAFHVSRATLARRFQHAYGEAPAAVLRRRRLERARELLARGDGNVSETAYAVGYGSLSVFSRAYREHFGVAPSRGMADASAQV